MGFREALEEICTVEGAVAACVMGFDGIAIDTVKATPTDRDIDTLMVEYSGLLAQVRQASEMLQTGTLSEVSIGTEELMAHLRPIDSEFFVVLAMTPDGNHGKGRFLVRLSVPKFQAEL